MESLGPVFISGLALGLSGGLAPGPLLTLTISQTLRYGAREGFKIALAPLLTDAPIILGAVFILSKLARVDWILGLVSLLGGLYLIRLGWESVTFKGAEYKGEEVRPQSIRKGVIANFLNPSPYLFWLTIGAPILVKLETQVILGGGLFIAGMYFCLVGSKVLVAWLTSRSRGFLSSGNYIFTVRFLGLALWAFAGVFLFDAWKYMISACS